MKRKGDHPLLSEQMSLSDFRNYYWMKHDLVAFARRLGLPAHGYKPALVARIERRLCGLCDAEESKGIKEAKASPTERDSNKPLTRRTPVMNYKSDDRTRVFFEKEIGSHFHFTYHLNQYRLRNTGLTYGDLIDEWIAEHERRKNPGYKASIASHGEYNRYIRDFFADSANNGSTLNDAVVSWKHAKRERGDRSYVSHTKSGRRKR